MSHAGGAVPFLAWRIAGGYEMQNPGVGDVLTHTAESSTGASYRDILDEGAPQLKLLQRFYYDTALSATPYAFAALKKLVPASQILFGSDYPYAKEFVIAETIKGLQDYGEFSETEIEQVMSKNATKLFPRLSQVY